MIMVMFKVLINNVISMLLSAENIHKYYRTISRISIILLKGNQPLEFLRRRWIKKNKMNKLWKFEQNPIMRSKVMTLQSFRNTRSLPAHGDPGNRQIGQNLWRHVGQLSMPFVHVIVKNLINIKIEIKNQHGPFKNTCKIKKAMLCSGESLSFCVVLIKKWKNWDFVYKRNDELSDMTS